MSVSDLTGTTWLINGTFTEPASTIDAYINFISNSANFVEIKIYDGSEPGSEQSIRYTTQDQDPIIVCEQGWTDEAYRTIAITGGEDATNSSLITWLENNATQVVQTGDVIVSYAGADIATMSDSGTKTLKTQGKYCTDDITIEYTKPSGGSDSVYVFTGATYSNTDVSVNNKTISRRLAYQVSVGDTITFRTYSSFILDTVTGVTSGNTVQFTTVRRGEYTFTMPNESVECSLVYDD